MRHLNALSIIAILLISTSPLYAQRQQQNVLKLKSDARNTVGIIGDSKILIAACLRRFRHGLQGVYAPSDRSVWA